MAKLVASSRHSSHLCFLVLVVAYSFSVATRFWDFFLGSVVIDFDNVVIELC